MKDDVTKENIKDDKCQNLLENNKKNQKIYGQTFPLGYKDKREKIFYKPRKSKNSSKSGSSESIEEKNEELEDENLEFINKQNITTDNDSNNKDEINIDILQNNENALNEDSDSEIVEEEIISEEVIAQIYKNEEILKEKNNQEINLNSNDNINLFTPISESTIVKEIDLNETKDENKLKERKKREKKDKVVKKKENILFKYFNHKYLIDKLRIITIIILIFYLCLITVSEVIYVSFEEKKTLFCFEFFNKNETDSEINEKFFLSDRNSFFIVHILLTICFISIIITLMNNEYLQLKHFFKEMSIYFPLTLVLNTPIFFMGIIQNKYDDKNDPKILTPIIFSILTFLGLFLMGRVLINVKKHKYKSISSLINISITTSFLTAFECYCFIYCICYIIRSYFIKVGENLYEEKMYGPEIIAGLIYFAIGFFMITTYKDIYFNLIVVIIEIGLLYIRKNYSIAVVCFNIINTFFSFASIIISIFKYKKKVFGLAHVD